jgi:hypothetical protein
MISKSLTRLCESYHAIDLAWLRRKKVLALGVPTTVGWSRAGRPSGSVSVELGENGVTLDYRTRPMGEEWREVREFVPFTYTATAFSGHRRWFACPQCGRPCRVLYGGARFRCRRCHRLRYESQYEAPWASAGSRAQRVRLRLGGSANLLEPFPARPKHMQRRTYSRLRALDAGLMARSTAGLASRIGRLQQGMEGSPCPRG